jgi:hypothetical protein
MLQFNKGLVIFLLLLAVGLFGVSCENGKWTGGGTIPSRGNPEEPPDASLRGGNNGGNNGGNIKKANFGYNIDACDVNHYTGEGLTSNVTFHDKWATDFGNGGGEPPIKNGVMLRGWVVDADACEGFFQSDECKICNGSYVKEAGCRGWRCPKVYVPGPVQVACSANMENGDTENGDGYHFNVAALVEYESQNPKAEGEGSAIVCLSDNGEGKNAPDDTAAVYIEDGPYYGYVNCNYVSGNNQEHSCDAEE